MISRRDFFKKLILGAMAWGINIPLSSFGSEGYHVQVPPEVIRDACDKSILCYSSSDELKNALMECAKDYNCEVYFCDPNSELLLWGIYFVSIIDRNEINRGIWDDYVRESSNYTDTACLIVDNMKHIALPSNINVSQYDKLDMLSIDTIKYIIKSLRVRNIKELKV